MNVVLCLVNLSFIVIEFICILKWSQDYNKLYNKYNDLRVKYASLNASQKVGK